MSLMMLAVLAALVKEPGIFLLFRRPREAAPEHLREAEDRIEGVRNSWLIFARNCDLARLAASAASFASRKLRSARTWLVMSRAVPR